MKAFKRIRTVLTDLNKIQDNIKEFVTQFDYTLLEGQFINNIDLTTSDTQITHKLSRDYKGYIIVGKDANQDVWLSATQEFPDKFLTLTASGNVTVNIYIF